MITILFVSTKLFWKIQNKFNQIQTEDSNFKIVMKYQKQIACSLGCVGVVEMVNTSVTTITFFKHKNHVCSFQRQHNSEPTKWLTRQKHNFASCNLMSHLLSINFTSTDKQNLSTIVVPTTNVQKTPPRRNECGLYFQVGTDTVKGNVIITFRFTYLLLHVLFVEDWKRFVKQLESNFKCLN